MNNTTISVSVILVMVSNSCFTSGRVRVNLVMVSSNSCSTSGIGRVTLVMVTVPALLVTEVVVFLLWKVCPALLVTEVVLLRNCFP
jgi:hypothetical protein